MGPRADIPRLVHCTKIHPLDGLPVWSIVCVVIRGGHRRQGVAGQVIEGAVGYPASRGAPAVEADPVDPGARRIDSPMAFVGSRVMFERAGFELVGQTDAMASKLPGLVMRRMSP